MKGVRDPLMALAQKRRVACPGAVTVVLLVLLPQVLVFFLFGDRLASIAADYLVKPQEEQSPGNAASATHADRLLGGLLSPNFSEPATSCLSRYAISKLWKPSPFPVSPYLAERLRQYEANHRRCGPHTARYREAVAELESGRNVDGAACKYLVWLPIEGLGNRILSLVSTFLYALLTGRVLLIEDTPEMAGLFCEPFPGSSWLLPPDFPRSGFWAGSRDDYATMLLNGVVRHDDDGGGPLPPFVYFHLQQSGLRLPNHTFCEEDHRAVDRFSWMMLRSESYYAVALFLVPQYRAELGRMFPAKGSVFNHLGRYLLHPGNRVWALAERFFDGYLAAADERVGIQVRIVPGNYAVPFEVMYEQILRCTREHGLLPQVTDAVRPPNGTATSAKKKTAVLVVSLKPEYYDKLHGMYYSNATAAGEVVTVYQPSHDQDQNTAARTHNEHALAEIFLLSFCDRVVTTSWSTFGYVAHALAGLRPWMLSPLLDWSGMRADVACVRLASVEPCLHSPPSFFCRKGADLDPVAHTPFMRHCEDVSFGLKLFD